MKFELPVRPLRAQHFTRQENPTVGGCVRMWLKIVSDQAELKVIWGNARGAHPTCYHISKASLQSEADKARRELEKLVEWWKNKNPATLPEILRSIADYGHKLRFNLFDPLMPELQEPISRVKEWISEQQEGGDTELVISTDGKIYVPWSIVFDGNIRDLGEDRGDLEHFKDFWGLRHHLTTLFEGIVPAGAFRPRPRDRFSIISVLHRKEFDDAAKAALDSDEQALLHQLLNIRHPPPTIAFNVRGTEQIVEQRSNANVLFHFFCHGEGDKLLLDGDEHIDLTHFKLFLNQLSPKPADRKSQTYSLVFLNACETGFGNLSNSFFVATARPGICGYIGSEARVPKDFAVRFGFDLLKCMLLEGLTVRETIHRLRRKHWPLSLLYGCYSYLDYGIAPPFEDLAVPASPAA